jgi:hypothetical protein
LSGSAGISSIITPSWVGSAVVVPWRRRTVDGLVVDPDRIGTGLEVREPRHVVAVDGRRIAVVASADETRLFLQVLLDQGNLLAFL